MLFELVDICWRPTLKKRDVERLRHLALGFYRHFEQQYFREDPERIQLCNYTLHLLLHLAEGAFESEPPVGYSQYWMERYIGWILGRMNARNLAAASLMNDAKFIEAYKSFFRVPVEKDGIQMIRDLKERGRYELRGPKQTYWVASNEDMDELLSSCLRGYFMRTYDGLTSSKVIDILDVIDHVQFRPRLRFICGSAVQDTMARIRPGIIDLVERRSRVSCHIAAEMEDGSRVEVYFGRVKMLFEVEVNIEDTECSTEWNYWQRKYEVALIKWATGLQVGEKMQVYKNCSSTDAFRSKTVEDLSIVSKLISVVDHIVPSQQSRSGSRQRCYFIDHNLASDFLLDTDTTSVENKNRVLCGIRGQR
ncbi:hypothetical protein BWQ96_07769 [Gracilariopsis chorda]|uniref:Uncharacterized protein n=1 Tax=Gracilariopsis chorda TaxID=448386 RepID=A0A2V3IKA9_9FLOR|nr:hypothetical protein BWQ96_07769 [Gracilariopsis chorda]|eukprot:PXF42507.1 hypothetical protein BWQ96_07769 [Gracilariopsis chorda]